MQSTEENLLSEQVGPFWISRTTNMVASKVLFKMTQQATQFSGEWGEMLNADHVIVNLFLWMNK